jgi:type I restriction enzyme S subunit
VSFPRYARYKDSGVEWLGEVPAHWKVVPLKHLANFINGAAFKPTDWKETGLPIIRIENLNGGEDFNHFEGDLHERYFVHSGDLLFGWSGNRGTSFGPFIWAKPGKYALNQHIFRVGSPTIPTLPLYWILKAVTFHVEEQAHGIIGMVHVTKGDLGSIAVPTPPSEELDAISSFLASETAKLDALITEQRRLIELLNEKRQAVISHAVTMGMSPIAALKPLGVEALGHVPTHWDVGPLKRFCDRITDGAHISPETENGQYPFVSTRDVRENWIDFENCLRTSESSFAYLVRSGCRPERGDVLFSKDGTIGRTVVISEDRDFVVASSLIIIRPDRELLNAQFLHRLCQSRPIALQVDSFVKGAGLPRLSIQNLRRVMVCVPPLNEQEEIVKFLENKLGGYDGLILEAERAIGLLYERRTALISAAVTGKIDVRRLADAAEAA